MISIIAFWRARRSTLYDGSTVPIVSKRGTLCCIVLTRKRVAFHVRLHFSSKTLDVAGSRVPLHAFRITLAVVRHDTTSNTSTHRKKPFHTNTKCHGHIAGLLDAMKRVSQNRSVTDVLALRSITHFARHFAGTVGQL